MRASWYAPKVQSVTRESQHYVAVREAFLYSWFYLSNKEYLFVDEHMAHLCLPKPLGYYELSRVSRRYSIK